MKYSRLPGPANEAEQLTMSCARGELALHTVDGARRRIGDAFVWYDARWRSDGTLAALDEHGMVRSSTLQGEPYADDMPSNLRADDVAGSLARGPQPQIGLAALKRGRVDHHYIADMEARLQHALG